MSDVTFDLGTRGPLSMAHSPELVHVDNQQAAVQASSSLPLPAQPVSVNAWNGLYNQTQVGRIIGNLVV
jgi:hypothetical protein